MQELIQKMLRVEEDARKLVQEAETEARKAVAVAQQDAQAQAERTLEAARHQARQLVEDAARDALNEKRQVLEQRRADAQAAIGVDDAGIRDAADAVLQIVLGRPAP